MRIVPTVIRNAKNCFYPNRVEVSDAKELQKAVRFDHVCAEYQKNYRSNSNFTRSNVLVMDCDNDHSEDPADWITEEKLDEMMTDISYAVAYSRNHMKEKDGKIARPKLHVYFEISETSDPDYYAALKAAVQKKFPFFDDNALDAARFIFGADTGECIWHEGWIRIDEEVTVDPSYKEESEKQVSSGPITEGNRNNLKLTTPEDLKMAEALLGTPALRIGQGYDVHAFAPQRALVLCGVTVPSEQGLLGHSDADVAAHALMDALLGALALGDIGKHFPDTDPRYKDVSSLKLLAHVMELLRCQGASVVNADVTIVAQKPKLAGYMPKMRARVAQGLGVPENRVNVKATTTERMGFEGEEQGISAQAVALLISERD